ncbi:MAG: hypothetical protein JNK87_24125 [Bryobacterales bacterium]|nr:hypothetical protein [Bryobacterales bacterium]
MPQGLLDCHMSHHPTILIGYGQYGRRCLQTLLANAAARGVLPWEDTHGTELFSDRRLQSLALFYVPDLFQAGDDGSGAFAGRDNFEMMQDLYGQIETVEPKGPQPGLVLAQQVEKAKSRLFAEYRLTRSGPLNIGLDVILLARPLEAAAVGRLSELIAPVMEHLARDPGFQAIEGQDLLNFIEILDFEDFWDDSPRQSATREAIYQELERAKEADDHRRPAFGRVYLFDGRTERGNHDEVARRDEAVLFLEFLLLEGHRTQASTRTFYVREPLAHLLCTVGIRAIEFSSARLRRLAAASFARGWLGHLAGRGTEAGTPNAIEPVVTSFLPPSVEETFGPDRVESWLQRGLHNIEQGLLRLDPAATDWPLRVEETARELASAQRSALLEESAKLTRELVARHVNPLPDEIHAAVSGGLSDDSFPRTAGSMVQELDDTAERIMAAASSRPSLPAVEPALAPSAQSELHLRYLDFRARQVDPTRLRNWWLLFAVSAAIAFLPIWRDLWQEVLGEDWASAGWQTTFFLLSLLLLFWAIGAKLFQPWIELAVARPLEFFTHPQRGRFAALLRRKVHSAEIEGALRSTAYETLRAQRQSLAAKVCAQLAQTSRPLKERQREMRWLSTQLEGYLKLHRVNEHADPPQYHPDRELPRVLRVLETDQDLAATSSAHPRNQAEYHHVQRTLRIFEHWHVRFSPTFLDPHRFLDQIATVFPESFEERRVAAGVIEGLSHYEDFPASFQWLQASGLPQERRSCSIPAHWLRLDGVNEGLLRGGYHQSVLARNSGDRLYLLQGRLGIPHELLRVAGRKGAV